MPRIPNEVADCSIYLYRSEEDARQGAQSGGCGFLVHVRSKADPTKGHLYAVASSHVLENGFQTIRLTTKSGGIDTLSTTRDNWTPHPDGDDVEVMPLPIMDYFKWWSVATSNFITNAIIESYDIGFGDEAILVGRLVNHEGRQRNTPIIRFGNIALMADAAEKVRFRDQEQESFLVDCRSLSGMSGSAVFVSTTRTYHGDAAERVAQAERTRMEQESGTAIPPGTARAVVLSTTGTWGPWLLGIDLGHIPMMKTVYQRDEVDPNILVETNHPKLTVDANTGIACVLPAWKILDVLNVEELVKERNREEKKIAREKGENNPLAAVEDVADGP